MIASSKLTYTLLACALTMLNLAVHFTTTAQVRGSRPPIIRPPTKPGEQARAAIDAKYISLGGSRGFMGLPTSLHTAAQDGVGHYRHYAGGSIFWTAGTGARVVRGAIRVKYAALGWERSSLGYPTLDELSTPGGFGYFSHFQHGSIYWTDATGAHEVYGAIRDKWASLGWEAGFLGYPLTGEMTTPEDVGRYNHFQGGSIYWTPSTGAHEVHGAIRDKWASLGWERSPLGYPLTDELITPDAIGRYTNFQGGSIYWTPSTGAHAVIGAIRDKWASLGWERSPLGYPLTDELINSFSLFKDRFNKFQGGSILYNPLFGARTQHDPMWTELRIQAILLKDDNGSNAVNMTGAEIAKWVDYANKVFAPGLIQFKFNPAADCVPLNSTELNQGNLPLDRANTVAAKYPGKIVVFFRARSGGNGYSWGPETGINFVAMPAFTETTVCGHQNIAQLAHDLGHYLGLPHTFPGSSNFKDVATAKQWLRDGNTMDGDGFSDTAEDPSVTIVNGCGPDPLEIFFEGKTYTPPRINVMSYYSDNKSDFDKSPLIQKLTPQQFDRVYEVLKVRKLM